MKPFNLERAKAGDPVVTRGGQPARIICFDRKGDCPIIALVEDKNMDCENIRAYTLNGGYHQDTSKNDLDLLMSPKKHTRWVNIYECDETNRMFYKTEEEALSSANSLCGYICTKKIEWDDDEKGGAK